MASAPSIETSLPPPAGNMVPGSPDELTPLWLTACLRHAGALGSGQVRSFTQQRIGQGSGFAGYLSRIALDYDDPLPDSPRTLIGKFASEHDAMRDMMGDVGGYRREVRFYRELAADVGVPTPRCYLAHYDEEQKRFLLLLEDMAPAASPDRVTGMTVEQGKQVLGQLARMHAHWWERTDQLPWLELDDHIIRQVRERYLGALPGFLTDWGGRYPTVARVARAIAHMFEGDEWVQRMRAGPRTLVHNDMHTQNVFLPTAEGGRIAFIDWQGVSFGRHGITDVTRLLCMGMQPEQRRAHTDELLRHYHGALLALGVKGYSLRELRARYREEMIGMTIVAVMAFDTIDLDDVQGAQDAQDADVTAVIGDRIEAAVGDARVARAVSIFVWMTRALRWLRRLLGRGREQPR